MPPPSTRNGLCDPVCYGSSHPRIPDGSSHPFPRPAPQSPLERAWPSCPTRKRLGPGAWLIHRGLGSQVAEHCPRLQARQGPWGVSLGNQLLTGTCEPQKFLKGSVTQCNNGFQNQAQSLKTGANQLCVLSAALHKHAPPKSSQSCSELFQKTAIASLWKCPKRHVADVSTTQGHRPGVPGAQWFHASARTRPRTPAGAATGRGSRLQPPPRPQAGRATRSRRRGGEEPDKCRRAASANLPHPAKKVNPNVRGAPLRPASCGDPASPAFPSHSSARLCHSSVTGKELLT